MLDESDKHMCMRSVQNAAKRAIALCVCLHDFLENNVDDDPWRNRVLAVMASIAKRRSV